MKSTSKKLLVTRFDGVRNFKGNSKNSLMDIATVKDDPGLCQYDGVRNSKGNSTNSLIFTDIYFTHF